MQQPGGVHAAEVPDVSAREEGRQRGAALLAVLQVEETDDLQQGETVPPAALGSVWQSVDLPQELVWAPKKQAVSFPRAEPFAAHLQAYGDAPQQDVGALQAVQKFFRRL